MTTPHSTISVTPSLLTELLDKSPYGVVAYEAVRDGAGQILDYRTVYHNAQALAVTGHTAEQINTQLLFQRAPHDRSLAELLKRVVDEQQATTSSYFNPLLNRWFDADYQPLTNGFFVTCRRVDHLEHLQPPEGRSRAIHRGATPTQPQTMLDSVVNTSPAAIVVKKAVRNEHGHIVDFQIVLINPAALAIGNNTEETVLGQSISHLNPDFKPSGMLDKYIAVMETGEPMSTDFFHAPAGKFLDLSVTRMDAEHVVVLLTDTTKAKRDAAIIQQQNDLLDGVLSTSENAIVVYEAVRNKVGLLLDFRVQLVNEASRRVSGRSREQLTGRLLTELYPNTRKFGLWDKYVAVYETGETFRTQHFYPEVDKWYAVTINKLNDGLVATFSDITSAKQLAQRTESQARLFDGVLNSMTSGLSVLEAVRDESGGVIDVRYVRVSRAILTDTGLTESQLIGKGMLSVFPGVKQTAYWSAYLAALDTGEPQHFESHYHYDGFDNYTDSWVTRIDENLIISTYTVINDYKQATFAIKRQAERTESVLNGAINGILLLEMDPANETPEFIIRSANQASASILGLSIDTMINQPMSRVFPNYGPIGFQALFAKALTTGQPQRAELDCKDANGLDGCYDVSAVKQEENGIVLTFMDISEQRSLHYQRERLLADLKSSNANLEQFAYIASHDLQEPLRKIQSFGDILLDHYSRMLSEDGRDMLRRMQGAAERMSVLIHDLLAYSRLSMEQEPFAPIDLNTIISGIQTDLELVIAEKNARIMTDALPTVFGNSIQLRQLFQNLLTNALKFSHPGGSPRIRLSVRPVQPEDVPARVPNRRNHSWIAIEVTDNGIGFDEQYQERIFQLFERLHGRSEYTGTGIGLAICQKVTENHGGTITARSRPGEGATFTIYLPESEKANE